MEKIIPDSYKELIESEMYKYGFELGYPLDIVLMLVQVANQQRIIKEINWVYEEIRKLE